MTKKNKNLIDRLIKLLKSIYDPEFYISIYDLGLIYDIQIKQRAYIKIIMTLTTPNCPVSDIFFKKIKQKIKTIDIIKYISIILTFNPIWKYNLLNNELL